MIVLFLESIINITSFILTILSAILLSIGLLGSSSQRRSCSQRRRANLFSKLAHSFKSFWKEGKCHALNRELLQIVRDRDIASRLVMSAKLNYPGKSEEWYLEKVIYDLRRGR
ncbi:MAG TPA: hypothetical protein DEG17_16455 [Cyanobacteria bacterium UBA11149]|nr:hypothetical protein [Cyanobacteria bacterium UBA11367]HBE57606.1 hypothetical protein [Cyanobacteria bacterium UBA11366]HBK65402.1 hypothetical protein [Cyanobacteria bacterium UBA11166]HBR74048.1 hypothetical protein [Cyanobacteria bacterium UBA11159]HBS69168.1 hypothetical protein [Cyanobacteria bacterium UBA11153]HBW90416.1 hypothetical protein [Cyanobacteria bacterium UBA11149]HCA93795.1 hypothetical protein [Cyanobacteria bacterium UBA9226]